MPVIIPIIILKTEFPLHWRLPTGGGLVFVSLFPVIAAGVRALSLSNSEGGRLELELPVPLLSSELSELLLGKLLLGKLLLGKLLLLLGRLLLGGVRGPLQAISARYHSLSRDSRVTMPGISPFIPALCLSQQNAYYARNYARIIAASLTLSRYREGVATRD